MGAVWSILTFTVSFSEMKVSMKKWTDSRRSVSFALLLNGVNLELDWFQTFCFRIEYLQKEACESTCWTDWRKRRPRWNSCSDPLSVHRWRPTGQSELLAQAEFHVLSSGELLQLDRYGLLCAVALKQRRVMLLLFVWGECPSGPVDYWNMACSSMMPPTMSSAPSFHPSSYGPMTLPIDANMYLNPEIAGLPSMPHFRNGVSGHSQAPPSLIPSSYSTPTAQMNIPSSQTGDALGKALASVSLLTSFNP